MCQESGIVQLYDCHQGRCIRSQKVSSVGIFDMAYFAKYDALITANVNGSISILNATSLQVVKNLSDHTGWIGCLKLQEEYGLLISGGEDQQLRVWQVLNGQIISKFQSVGSKIYCVEFTRLWDAAKVIAGDLDGYISVYDMESSSLNARIRAHASKIWKIQALVQEGADTKAGSKQAAAKSNKKILLSCGSDHCFKIFSAKNLENLFTLNFQFSVYDFLVFEK